MLSGQRQIIIKSGFLKAETKEKQQLWPQMNPTLVTECHSKSLPISSSMYDMTVIKTKQ